MIYQDLTYELKNGVPMIEFVDYKMKNSYSVHKQFIFVGIVLILTVISIIGNVATLITCMKRFHKCPHAQKSIICLRNGRRIRMFFRTCLISLACSDLMNSTLLAASYSAEYFATYAQAWVLGELLCKIIPLLTTMGMLANCMTLVAIASDRYLTIIKIVRGKWEPNAIRCTIFAVIIWALSAAIASPLFHLYTIFPINIILTDPKNVSHTIGFESAHFCTSKTYSYHMIIFTILLSPMAIVFIWLNMTIARIIWIRWKIKNKVTYETKNFMEESTLSDRTSTKETKLIAGMTRLKNKSIGKNVGDIKINTPRTRTRINCDSRQLRTFYAILLLVLTFLVFRAPIWVYVIVKFLNKSPTLINWELQHYSGIMVLFHCAINPFLYAFLTETIQYTGIIRKKIKNYCVLRKLFASCTKTTSNSAKIYVIPTDK